MNMNLVRRDPFSEMVNLSRAMDRLVDSSFIRPFWLGASESDAALVPAIDMYETDKDVVVKAVMPSVEAKRP